MITRNIICAALLAALFLFPPAASALNLKASDLNTSFCPRALIIPDDGDTFRCGNETIRILGIDTPEIKHPDHGIDRDQPGGRKAAAYTKHALKKAGQITYVRKGPDQYGRTLAHVFIDGELLSVRLIKAGLAYETISKYGKSGFPEFALAILEAAKTSRRPDFEDPFLWRRQHQRNSTAQTSK